MPSDSPAADALSEWSLWWDRVLARLSTGMEANAPFEAWRQTVGEWPARDYRPPAALMALPLPTVIARCGFPMAPDQLSAFVAQGFSVANQTALMVQACSSFYANPGVALPLLHRGAPLPLEWTDADGAPTSLWESVLQRAALADTLPVLEALLRHREFPALWQRLCDRLDNPWGVLEVSLNEPEEHWSPVFKAAHPSSEAHIGAILAHWQAFFDRLMAAWPFPSREADFGLALEAVLALALVHPNTYNEVAQGLVRAGAPAAPREGSHPLLDAWHIGSAALFEDLLAHGALADGPGSATRATLEAHMARPDEPFGSSREPLRAAYARWLSAEGLARTMAETPLSPTAPRQRL